MHWRLSNSFVRIRGYGGLLRCWRHRCFTIMGLFSLMEIFWAWKLWRRTSSSTSLQNEVRQDRGVAHNHSGIIMGTGLARKLNARLGDRVVITTPQGYTLTLKIVGTFQMGLGAIDNVRSYANISTAQAILQKARGISPISMSS